jgi:hypothetical protein
LICAERLGPNLGAADVIGAVARGLIDADLAEPDAIELPADLKATGFETRMRAAFAVVLCVENLVADGFGDTLAGRVATDARQAGVACHAICAREEIDAFTARIYDLQTIRTANSRAELQSAARALVGEL